MPALVVDGSSQHFFAGILNEKGEWLSRQTSPDPPLESLFTSVDEVLKSCGLELESIRSYIYCEGPGSVLGLRLCAMAIEVWRRLSPSKTRLFSYNSLQLTAAGISIEGLPTQSALLISDWKKAAWNGIKLDAGAAPEVSPIESAIAARWSGPLYHLPARKGWQEAPAHAHAIAYAPEQVQKHLQAKGLLRETKDIELYSAGANTFQKWTPERHRAPGK
ncbi:MAG: hypothetical protein ACPGIC_06690 [Opitutales bacterium]